MQACVESIIICFELTVVNAATYCFLIYGVALNQQPLFSKSLAFTSAHTMLPRIAYLFGAGRQTQVLTADDGGQGQTGSQEDVCELMASPK